MAGLFPDDVMNLGCDETGSSAPCTLENTKSFEVKMIEHLLALKKAPPPDKKCANQSEH